MGIQERKAREKKQRRKDIIDAAERVFFSKGFNSSTIDDIAAEAELSKGTLYLYFKSKGELCISIVLRGLKIVHSMFEEVFNKDVRAIDKIGMLGDTYLYFHDRYKDYSEVLINYRNRREMCDDSSKSLRETIEENEKINNVLIKIIESGIEDGSIRKDVAPIRTSYAIWGALSGLLPSLMLSDNKIEQFLKFQNRETLKYIFGLLQDALRA